MTGLGDADWLREQYHGEGRTQADIAEELGVTQSAVSRSMRELGLETRGQGGSPREVHLDPEWLREKYEDDGMTMREIADEVGCSDSVVMRRLREEGVEARERTLPDARLLRDLRRVAEGAEGPVTTTVYDERGEHAADTLSERFGSWSRALEEAGLGDREHGGGGLGDAARLRELYHGKGLTQREIAEEAGVARSTVGRRMRELGVETRTVDERLKDAEWLRERYVEDGMTMEQIADETGCSHGTVVRRLRDAGVETRGNAVDDERLGDEEWLRERYVGDGMTMEQIADEVGCSDGTVMRRLRDAGVETGSGRGEALEALEAGRVRHEALEALDPEDLGLPAAGERR